MDVATENKLRNLIKRSNPKDNLLTKISYSLDDEVNKYVHDIILDFKENIAFKDIDTKILRRKLFEENKELIIEEIKEDLLQRISELEEDNKQYAKLTQFSLTDAQEKQVEQWDKEHSCSIHKDKHGFRYTGAIGGRLTYKFTPTSVGVFVEVRCSCGEKLSLE